MLHIPVAGAASPAAKHAAALPYVDPTRIYLGGHSTGGTLALLVAGSSDLFRAVICYGPVESVAGYGGDNLPFDPSNKMELVVRAPLACLAELKTPTLVLEGTEKGNIDSLQVLRDRNQNPLIRFHEIPGATHFNLLAPFNALFAKKLLADTGKTCDLGLTNEEIDSTVKLVKPGK